AARQRPRPAGLRSGAIRRRGHRRADRRGVPSSRRCRLAARDRTLSVRLEVSVERWPIAGRFTIARGSRTEAVVVVATIRAGEHVGRGECVPYARYGETVEGVAAEIETQWQLVEHG